MPVILQQEIHPEKIDVEGAHGTFKANVIGEGQGWKSHTLRLFRLEPGGYTPRHRHAWEHVNYVISGKGTLRLGEEIHEISAGDFAFVPPDSEHQFKNPYDQQLEFICIVPASAAS